MCSGKRSYLGIKLDVVHFSMTKSILTAQLQTLHCLHILNCFFLRKPAALGCKTLGYNSCVSEDSSILEILDAEYEGTMIL
jgi:hypothetical protein